MPGIVWYKLISPLGLSAPMRLFAGDPVGKRIGRDAVGDKAQADCADDHDGHVLAAWQTLVEHDDREDDAGETPWAEPPEESALNQAYQIFVENGQEVEYLIGYEGNQFAYTGNVEEDILSITSVHPMRSDAVEAYLKKAESNDSIIEKLVREGELVVTEYNGRKFFLRKLFLSKKGSKE